MAAETKEVVPGIEGKCKGVWGLVGWTWESRKVSIEKDSPSSDRHWDEEAGVRRGLWGMTESMEVNIVTLSRIT